MSTPDILVVEDETAIADTIVYALNTEQMRTRHCLLGQEALALMRQEPFDLVILDVGLPDMSGFDVCRKLRSFSDIPVIFLTARSEEIDRVVGLEIGADDYVVKPFSPRELAARVRVILRRAANGSTATVAPSTRPASSPTDASPFLVDADGARISYRGHRLELTRYEYLLLASLLARPGRIHSRAQLMDAVWNDALDTADRTVDTHIKTLRAKLREAGCQPDPIRTHRGLGYSLEI